MSRTLVISPEAEDDLADAKRWYDARRYGLGANFLESVGDSLDTIQRIPLVPRLVFQDLRRILVRRFPYAIFYRVTDDQITVVAVYHTRRDPRGGQERA